MSTSHLISFQTGQPASKCICLLDEFLYFGIILLGDSGANSVHFTSVVIVRVLLPVMVVMMINLFRGGLWLPLPRTEHQEENENGED